MKKKYGVTMGFFGHVTTTVEANSEEEAIKIAPKSAYFDICHQCSDSIHFDDWDSEWMPECFEIDN